MDIGDSLSNGARWAVLAQAAATALALVIMLALPPRTGPAMLVTIGGQDGSTLAWVAAAQGRVVRQGPFPGSFIIAGPRARLLPAALRHGSLLLPGGTSCGATQSQDART